MSGLVFENMEVGLKGAVRHFTLWQPAPDGRPGFNELECVLLDEEPPYDLLKDIPVQQFKSLHLPPVYTGREPDYDPSNDTFLDVYLFNHRISEKRPGMEPRDVFENEGIPVFSPSPLV